MCIGDSMKVINFFESDRQEHWLKEIAKCDWGAGVFLHELLSKGTFFDAVGEGSRVLLLTDGDELIDFVYTFPQHRGHRCAGLLFAEIERLAKLEHVAKVYISTNHVGLYEKYGCEYFTQMNDMDGEVSRVYVKRIG